MVARREEFGHWEGDLLMFRKVFGKANVASLVERTSRYAVLLRNNDRQSEPIMSAVIDDFAPLPVEACRSFTFNRGAESGPGVELRPEHGADAWFCDPKAPWQKGAVENANRRIHRWLPRESTPSPHPPRPSRGLGAPERDAQEVPRLPHSRGGLPRGAGGGKMLRT